MAVAIARLRESGPGYEVAGVSDGHVVAGLENQKRVVAGFLLQAGEPLLLNLGSTIMVKELDSIWLHTIAAMELGHNEFGMMTVGSEIKKVEIGEYAVSDGLLVVGFMRIADLRENREIFGYSLEDGATGRWK